MVQTRANQRIKMKKRDCIVHISGGKKSINAISPWTLESMRKLICLCMQSDSCSNPKSNYEPKRRSSYVAWRRHGLFKHAKNIKHIVKIIWRRRCLLREKTRGSIFCQSWVGKLKKRSGFVVVSQVTRELWYRLLEKVKPLLRRQNSNYRDRISPTTDGQQ